MLGRTNKMGEEEEVRARFLKQPMQQLVGVEVVSCGRIRAGVE